MHKARARRSFIVRLEIADTDSITSLSAAPGNARQRNARAIGYHRLFDECTWRTRCRKAGFAHTAFAAARNPLQLHVVLRSRDRDPAPRRANVGAARGASCRASHRTLRAHA